MVEVIEEQNQIIFCANFSYVLVSFLVVCMSKPTKYANLYPTANDRGDNSN